MSVTISLSSMQSYFSQLNQHSKLGFAVAGVCGAYIGVTISYGTYRHLVNNSRRRKKEHENKQSIEALAGRLRIDPIADHVLQDIIALKIDQLIKELKAGKLRPIDVLKAYQTKALEAHHATACLVEAISEAERWALELENSSREGLLWGVPISIKDDVGIKGYDNTIGEVCNIGRPAARDCVLIKVLRAEGAIPFVKTNVPQTEMSFEPGNPICGTVHNPHKRGYGPGGSSSGEGALIGSKGSMLGIGSDILGSIRVPAHFCGVCGFKPTPERMSVRGMAFDGPMVTTHVSGTWGPLSQEVDGLVLLMEALYKDGTLSHHDPAAVPLPFNKEDYTSDRKLRIGFYTDNGLFPTFPGCVRAVEKAKDILRNKGHELVPWAPPNPAKAWELVWRVIFSDGATALLDSLKHDIKHPTIHPLFGRRRLPEWLRKIIGYSLRPWTYRREVQDSWNKAGIDAVICPPHVLVAPPLGNAKLLAETCIYSAMYNALHYPAGVVPMTVTRDDDLHNLESVFSSKDPLQRLAKAAMKETCGLPIGVMVAACRYQDEMCLRVMKLLEDAVN